MKKQIKENLFAQELSMPKNNLIIKNRALIEQMLTHQSKNPLNFETVMRNIGNKHSQSFDCFDIEMTCTIDTNGIIQTWELNKTESSVPVDSQIKEILKPFIKTFKFPILYAENIVNLKLSYKTSFSFFNVRGFENEREIYKQKMLSKLNAGLYNISTTPAEYGQQFDSILIHNLYGDKLFVHTLFEYNIFWVLKKTGNSFSIHQTIQKPFDDDFFFYEITDLDRDGYRDFIMGRHWNSNGNTWNDLYFFNKDRKILTLGADYFCCTEQEYAIKLINNEQYFMCSYFGSWLYDTNYQNI
jgi:hypothetical protein